ncbi:hypothetical protein BGZ54_002120 [Gamsiella multidivaricata]|nr:hypothetical protein BGZ54_002120 [Gamsiella multidivaricata]
MPTMSSEGKRYADPRQGKKARKAALKTATTLFSNERTFLHWIKFGILLGGLALTLLNFSAENTNEGIDASLANRSGKVGKIVGVDEAPPMAPAVSPVPGFSPPVFDTPPLLPGSTILVDNNGHEDDYKVKTDVYTDYTVPPPPSRSSVDQVDTLSPVAVAESALSTESLDQEPEIYGW